MKEIWELEQEWRQLRREENFNNGVQACFEREKEKCVADFARKRERELELATDQKNPPQLLNHIDFNRGKIERVRKMREMRSESEVWGAAHFMLFWDEEHAFWTTNEGWEMSEKSVSDDLARWNFGWHEKIHAIPCKSFHFMVTSLAHYISLHGAWKVTKFE